MFAFLNDISIGPPNVNIFDNWYLLYDLMEISSELKNKYKIGILKTPKNFTNLPIAGSLSINDYLARELDKDDYRRLSDFVFNRTDDDDTLIQNEIDNFDNGNPVDIYFEQSNSTLLTGAYLLEFPTLSFQSKNDYCIDKLSCNFVRLDTHANSCESDVEIVNIYSKNQICSTEQETVCAHFHFLNNLKAKFFSQNKNWNPLTNPCWNKEALTDIFAAYNYPHYKKGLSVRDETAFNICVSQLVLLSNGWEYNKNITDYNKGKDGVWRIYSPKYSTESVYISVDLSEQHFEILNRKGKWVQTIFYHGDDTGRDYSGDDSHDINV